MDRDREARIRERAYDIWIREGRPHGRDAEHWRKAEAEITAEETMAVGTPSGPTSGAAAEKGGEAPAQAAAPIRSRRAAPRSSRGGATTGQSRDGGANAQSGRKPPAP